MSASPGPQAVAVALSGGVDSSVAAALLVQQGLPVIGVTLQQWRDSGPGKKTDVESIERARLTAELLGIPHHIVDARSHFRSCIVDYLVSEYTQGRTPNPCVQCNRTIRFGLLLREVQALGATRLATGHYARVRHAKGRYELLRGVDTRKDQSYFLHSLDQSQLSRCLFPVGGHTKKDVRTLAGELHLPAKEAEESQDICFLAGGDYRAFLAREAPSLMKPGPILDQDGRVLGQHQGLPCYTIGQRKGLGIAASTPLYVVSIHPTENAIVVGTREELRRQGCAVKEMHYVLGEPPGTAFRASAQVRYRSQPTQVTVQHGSSTDSWVEFDDPQYRVAPGQFLVLYDGEIVLGGGAICERSASVL